MIPLSVIKMDAFVIISTESSPVMIYFYIFGIYSRLFNIGWEIGICHTAELVCKLYILVYKWTPIFLNMLQMVPFKG